MGVPLVLVRGIANDRLKEKVVVLNLPVTHSNVVFWPDETLKQSPVTVPFSRSYRTDCSTGHGIENLLACSVFQSRSLKSVPFSIRTNENSGCALPRL